MRLPFVSRVLHEFVIASKDEMLRLLHDELVEARRELAALRAPTKSVVAVAPVVFTESEDEKRIRRAINENSISGGKIDPRLQAHLRQYAAELRKQGKSVDEIEAFLGNWVSSEPANA
jgi:hypothetical protein